MLGIDTNVVIRLIISDDAEQTRRARKLVEQALSHDEPVLVSLLVLLESEWVLRSRYGFNRESLLGIFRALLASRELSFEDEPALEEALFRWKDSAREFSALWIRAGDHGFLAQIVAYPGHEKSFAVRKFLPKAATRTIRCPY